MTYSIQQASQLTGCPPSTLRYYEQHKLIPPIARNKSGKREYTQCDINCIMGVICLKNTGMELDTIEYFVQLMEQGKSTYPQQLELILRQKEIVESKLLELQADLAHLQTKIDFYHRELGIH